MGNLKQSLFAGIFSIFTIGVLTALTYKTELGIFIIASFGSSMVLLFGYPESPFAQPKNVFFGHLLTALVGMFFLHFIPLPLFIIIPLAVGFGVGLMILFNVTHPPAGGCVTLKIIINPTPKPTARGIIINSGNGIKYKKNIPTKAVSR